MENYQDYINSFLPKYKLVQKNANAVGLAGLMQYGMSFVLIIPILVIYGLNEAIQNELIEQIGQIIIYVAVLLIPFMLASKIRNISINDMIGREKPRFLVYIMTAFLCLGISAFASIGGGIIESILNSIGLSQPQNPYVMPSSAAAVFVQFLSIAIIPPIVEEICYRGFVLREASKTLGTWGAIWVSSILFCFMHESLTVIPLALGFGLLGGFLREKYGSILPSIIGHATVNSLYFGINYFTYSMADEQTIPIVLIVNATCLVLGAVGVIMLFSIDGFDYERFTSFSRPSVYGKSEGFRGYTSSAPFVILIMIMLFRTFYGLNFI